MHNWEDILAGYLEGVESRADAESLRWKIHLPMEVRQEVEAVLRLVDEVSAALGSVAVPDGAVARLQAALHGADDRPAPPRWPRSFDADRAGDSATRSAEDDAYAMIDGLGADAAADALPDDVADCVNGARALGRSLSELSRQPPPEGAVDRLLVRLRAGVASDSIDERAAAQFLGRLKTGSPRSAPVGPPDVLAASAERPASPET